MAIDISKTDKKLSKNEILDMKERVDKYLSQGGTITPERRIYIDYSTQEEYITYAQFQNILSRWEIDKPDSIQIYLEPVNISTDDKILPISTVLDMEERINKYLSNGGKISPKRRIYLNIIEQFEYISYEKYNEIISRVETFRKTHNRNPNFVYLQVKTNTNPNRVNAVGDDITPNSSGWYLSKRYPNNKNVIRQETNYWCGPNAIQLVWYELTGKLVSESLIAKYAETTTAGTGHAGLEKAIKQLAKKYNLNIKILWSYLSDLGYEKLAKLVKDEHTGVFIHNKYKNKYGHYEYVIGVNLKTEKLMVANSLSGGWIEYRSFKTMTDYINGINQKSIAQIFTK